MIGPYPARTMVSKKTSAFWKPILKAVPAKLKAVGASRSRNAWIWPLMTVCQAGLRLGFSSACSGAASRPAARTNVASRRRQNQSRERIGLLLCCRRTGTAAVSPRNCLQKVPARPQEQRRKSALRWCAHSIMTFSTQGSGTDAALSQYPDRRRQGGTDDLGHRHLLLPHLRRRQPGA